MKRIILILMALLPLSVFIGNADEKPTRQEIPLNPGQNKIKENRSLNPIECCYLGMMDFIQTSVYDDLGDIYVEVVNSSTGENVWDTFDSAETPQHLLPISYTPGHYLVTYITESGDIYEGSFTL